MGTQRSLQAHPASKERKSALIKGTQTGLIFLDNYNPK